MVVDPLMLSDELIIYLMTGSLLSRECGRVVPYGGTTGRTCIWMLKTCDGKSDNDSKTCQGRTRKVTHRHHRKDHHETGT